MEKSNSGKIRTNIIHPQAINFYVPTDDQSVPVAFNLGCHRIGTAKDSEGRLISGYFLVVCTVLPNLAPLAERIMNDLGFRVHVPSNISHLTASSSESLRLQAVKFAQMCLLPFLENHAEVDPFWTRIATGNDIQPTCRLFGSTEMKRIYSLLSSSALFPTLQKQITALWQNLMLTSPFGWVFSKVLEQNRSTKVYQLVMVEKCESS